MKIFILKVLLPLFFMFLLGCDNENIKKETKFNKESHTLVPIQMDTLAIKELGKILPKRFFVFNDKGIVIFQASDTAFYPWNTLVLNLTIGARSLTVLQKESTNSLLVVQNNELYFDAITIFDSLYAFNADNNFLLKSYGNLFPSMEVVYINSKNDFSFYHLPKENVNPLSRNFILDEDSIVFLPHSPG